MALPLGFTARRELLDLWLDAQVDEREMLAALRRSHPPGLQIIAMRQIAPEEPALQTQVRSASYVAAVPEVPDLQSRISALLAAEHACRERRGKGYDLRPLIEELAIRHDHAGTGALSMRLSAREGAMGRPDEVLRELGVDPAEAHIERLEIDLAMGNDW
jgi:radical SAM-linked protein